MPADVDLSAMHAAGFIFLIFLDSLLEITYKRTQN